MGQASTRPKGYRPARGGEGGVWPRLRLGLGHRQPDDLLGLLRRAGPGRTADAPDPPGAGHGLEPKIPLYVSGFGPRAMELAGKHGDGLIFAIPPRGVPVSEALAHARRGAEKAGRALTGFHTSALTNVALLEPGERIDSERVVRTVGPNVMASVYYFYDEVHERGIEPPPFLRPIWKRYCALVEKTPAEHRHFRTHEFHYTRLHPGEAELIDADLLRATCLVGTADELGERVRALEDVGQGELMFATGVGEKWAVAEAFARGVMARV